MCHYATVGSQKAHRGLLFLFFVQEAEADFALVLGLGLVVRVPPADDSSHDEADDEAHREEPADYGDPNEQPDYDDCPEYETQFAFGPETACDSWCVLSHREILRRADAILLRFLAVQGGVPLAARPR